jgi:hypothetical protein
MVKENIQQDTAQSATRLREPRACAVNQRMTISEGIDTTM